MLSTTRKNSVSAQTLFGDLITPSVQPASNVRTPTIPFSGMSVYVSDPYTCPHTYHQARRPRWSMDSSPALPKRITSGCPLQSRSMRVDGKRTGKSLSCLYVPLMSASLIVINALVDSQGRGAFGSVVKARNRIDNRIYAGSISYPSQVNIT